MREKLNGILFKGLNEREKEIWWNTMIQSYFLVTLNFIIILILKMNTNMFEEIKGLGIALVCIVVGYAYFVIKVACKGVLYTDKNRKNLKLITCVGLSLVSFMLIIAYFIYWRLEAFLYDSQREQFGLFILSGSLITSFYTISTWISFFKVIKINKRSVILK